MGSYDFVTADKFGKTVGPFLAFPFPCSCFRICFFSELDLTPWKNVDPATLYIPHIT